MDSGLHAEDSGFQSLAGSQIPWAEFRIPKPRQKVPEFPIPQAKFLGFRKVCYLTWGDMVEWEEAATGDSDDNNEDDDSTFI